MMGEEPANAQIAVRWGSAVKKGRRQAQLVRAELALSAEELDRLLRLRKVEGARYSGGSGFVFFTESRSRHLFDQYQN